ncbi:MAG: patatin-like phospholipase family protein [Pseudomonadota bacterium]
MRYPTRVAPVLAVSLALLAGCQPFNYTAPDAPAPLAVVPQFDPVPRVALVLGAGGPRGYAHIGVMRVLEAACIEFDLVVGTSVGSLIGVFWASGLSAVEIDARSKSGGPLTLFDPSLFADRGWIHGRKLQQYVNTELGDLPLEALPRKVVVVATHRGDKSPRYFLSGNSGVAVRASSAVPGIISPVGIDGVEFEDGDVAAPLAVSAARDAGAAFVIAVNVYPKPASVPDNASARARAQVERRARQVARQARDADFVIDAETPFAAGPRRAFFEAARAAGERAARARLPALMTALGAQHPPHGVRDCAAEPS